MFFLFVHYIIILHKVCNFGPWLDRYESGPFQHTNTRCAKTYFGIDGGGRETKEERRRGRGSRG